MKIVQNSVARMYTTDTSQNDVQEQVDKLTSRHMSSSRQHAWQTEPIKDNMPFCMQ